MSNNVKVVILCGGKGTRIREETEYKPKPLIEVGGRPILWHIMKSYAHYGYNDFILCLGYKGEMIKNYFLNYEFENTDITVKLGKEKSIKYHNSHYEDGWNITLADTGIDAMTGARLKKIEKYVDADLLMLTYGDGVANVNIAELISFHKSHKKIGTVTGVRPSSRFGELILDNHIVKEFSEKPQIKDGYINGGFFIFDRRIFNYVHDSDQCVFEQEPLERLAREKELMVFIHDGFWHCMDTYRDLTALENEWRSGKPPWKVW